VAEGRRSLTLHLDSCHGCSGKTLLLRTGSRSDQSPHFFDGGRGTWQVPAQHHPRATLPVHGTVETAAGSRASARAWQRAVAVSAGGERARSCCSHLCPHAARRDAARSEEEGCRDAPTRARVTFEECMAQGPWQRVSQSVSGSSRPGEAIPGCHRIQDEGPTLPRWSARGRPVREAGVRRLPHAHPMSCWLSNAHPLVNWRPAPLRALLLLRLRRSCIWLGCPAKASNSLERSASMFGPAALRRTAACGSP
jgi:hypothetical protein